MPRLIGKPTQAPMYVGLAFLVAVIGAGVWEYTGDLNFTPGFGDRQPSKTPMMGVSAAISSPTVVLTHYRVKIVNNLIIQL